MDRLRILWLACATFALAVPGAFAQDAAKYPEQPVRMVVPFSAGSMTDLLARVIGESLAQRWKQQVVVENRPGLAGTSSVAKGAADGYTLMLTSNGHTVISHLNKNLAFDPLKDFSGVSMVAITPLIMVVPPDSPVKTVKELIELAKSKPGALNYSSAGLGSTTGIAGHLLRQTTKIDIVHVPFKGLPETHTAIIRGDVAVGFSFFAAAGDLVLSGKVRPLAVTGNSRLKVLPDVPTFAEAGLPEYQYDSWFGIMAHSGVPKAIVEKVSADIADVLKQDDVKARFEPQGVVLASSKPADFDRTIQGDSERFGPLFKGN